MLAGACCAAFAIMPVNAGAQSVKETEASRALVRLDELEAQIRDLTNRVEILEAQNSALKEQISQNSANIAAKPPANDAAMPPQAAGSADTSAAPPATSTTTTDNAVAAQTNAAPVNTTAVSPNSVAANPPAPQNVQPVNPPAPAVFNAAKVLQTAKTQIQAGEYQNAEGLLTDFTTNHSDDANAPEAYWLLGETRYVQQAWAPAAQAYVAYLNKAPTGPKVPDVLVRIAGAFRELGDNNQRCKALNEYKKRAPNPSAILKARADAELAKAPCP